MIFSTPAIKGSIPINGIYVKSNQNVKSASADGENSGKSEWKLVLDDEARKINPLLDVNIKRSSLILQSAQSDDWSKYHEFEAKQHPAWYDFVDGKPVRNKIYYGNLLEARIDALKEAQMAGDQEKIAAWKNSVEEGIQDFKNAPGIVPYVVGLNHNESVASSYGVPEPDDSFFDSKYNNPLVLNEGKFETNMWYDNPVFKEDPILKARVENLVADKFPTSTTVAKAEKEAAEKIANEAEVMSGNESTAQTVNDETQDTPFSPVNDSILQLNEQKEDNVIKEQAEEVMNLSSFAFQAALKNLQESIKPNFQEIMDKYKYA